MRVLILHNAISPSAGPEDQDTLWQTQAVQGSLLRLGHSVAIHPVTLNLADITDKIQYVCPDVVFNLVERLAGTDRMISVVPQLLETMKVPFTGCGADSLTITSNKLWAKQRLLIWNLPTADWWTPMPVGSVQHFGLEPVNVHRPVKAIIKPVGEHGSIGMSDENVVKVNNQLELARKLTEFQSRATTQLFAERFIRGREVNVSILACPEGPKVLPPAEILFPNFPEGKPRVVGYNAKWAEGSFEYENTPRTFDFSSRDGGLLEQVRKIAIQCWTQFELRGYARVDFRIDENDRPWVLEINANPCLTPECGYWAALNHEGIDYDIAIDHILRDCCHHEPGSHGNR